VNATLKEGNKNRRRIIMPRKLPGMKPYPKPAVKKKATKEQISTRMKSLRDKMGKRVK